MYTKPFKELTKGNTDIAGGKGASLGEMINNNIPVPDGYVVLSTTFDKFLSETDLVQEIDSILHDVNHKVISTVEDASEQIQGLIKHKDIPEEIKQEILESFKKLDTKYVAVRSSATAEDGADHAWAGQLDSYLNTTEENILEKIQSCWASLFTPRAIFYRFEKDLHKTKISVAVVVQKMVDSEVSGIAFSVHPVTEDRNQLIIEAGFGLGEAIVSGTITPDSYVVEKEPRRILDINTNTQIKGLYRQENGGNKWIDISEPKASSQVLTKEQILELSEIILNIENHYGFPCDIEWAYENNTFYIVQSRPITTLGGEDSSSKKKDKLSSLLKAENVVKVEGDFVPFLMMIDWLNFYDKNGNFNNIYPLFGYYLNNRVVGYLDGDKYSGCSEEVFKDLVNGGQDIRKIEEKYNSSRTKIKDIYDRFFLDEDFDKSEKNLTSVYKNIYKELQELVAHTLFIEQLDENIISKEISEKQFDFEKIWKLVNYQTFLSFEIRNKNLILEYLRDKKPIKYLTYIFLNYSIIPDIDYLKKELGGYKIEELEKEIEENNILVSKENSIFEKEIKDLSEKEREIVDVIRWAMMTRDDRKNYMNMAESVLYHIAEELFDIWKLDKKLLRYVGMLEIPLGLDYLKDNWSNIKKRPKGFSWVISPDHSYEFNYENVESEINQLDEAVLGKLESKDEIKGSIGNPGIVKGRVRLVLKLEEFSDFQEGEILVTGMTRPEFVPLMKKAKAIITDEGGITSHAAIVSRELKKPCVIGTKIATQVLKDGDLVEVDADSGIVKVLKSKN